MRYLNNYQAFLEADIPVGDTDKPDIKMAKEKINTINRQITEYQEKKPKIDQLYSSTSNNKEIEDGLKKILGESDVNSKEDRNPFLVKYLEVARLKKEVEDIQNKNVKDKMTLDDFNQELSLSKDASTKQAVSFKISDIKNRISLNSAEIVKKMQEIQKREAESKTEMDKIKRDIIQNTQRINDIKQKQKKYRFFYFIYTVK